MNRQIRIVMKVADIAVCFLKSRKEISQGNLVCVVNVTVVEHNKEFTNLNYEGEKKMDK